MSERLWLRVTDDFVLDAGCCEEAYRDGEACRLVHPPSVPMFDQVLAYLESHAGRESVSIRTADQARVAVAVCIRWGTYLGLLLDANKPVMPEARQSDLSRLTNTEMKRINIESSYALARWIEIMHSDYWGRYIRLLGAAQRLLPLPQKSVKRAKAFLPIAGLAYQEVAQVVLDSRLDSPLGQEAISEAGEAPYRVLANALINAVWRNGPIENIHGGKPSGYALKQRRVTDMEARLLMREATERMINALHGLHAIIEEDSDRSLVQRVLPYRLVPDLLITPHAWTIHEASSEVWLPGAEP